MKLKHIRCPNDWFGPKYMLLKIDEKWGINNILLPLVFGILLYLVFCHTLYFFEFSTPSQNVIFHIYPSQMEIRLSEIIKFRTRKTIKKTNLISPCKIIICFRMWWQTFPHKIWVMDRGVPQDHKNKVLRPSIIFMINSDYDFHD